MAHPPVDARATVALLLRDHTRRMFALVELGSVPRFRTRTQKHALETLIASGLVGQNGDTFFVNVPGLRETVAAFSRPKPEGIGRFVRDGRIVNYPSSDADRIQLLEWVGRLVLQPEERIDESELNARLHSLMHEHVLLRRYLVDYRVLDRSLDGSWYELAPEMQKAPDHE